MFDFIPLPFYSDFYHYLLLLLSVMLALVLFKNGIASSRVLGLGNVISFVLFIAIVYMGERPISGAYFGDMDSYNQYFSIIKTTGSYNLFNTDHFFYYYMYLCTLVMDSKSFFLLTSFFYFLPIYIVCKVNFKNGAFYAILLFLASFSYWSYGTNGIRNGLASSIFLLAFCTNKKYIQALFLFLAIGMHTSLVVPSAALIISLFYKNTKIVLIGWALCVPISLIAGSSLQGVFVGLIDDDRTAYLIEGNANNDNFSSMSFRWDFLFYSATAVFAGWYYIFKKGFKDSRYLLIFSTYLITNGFWILMINANFSNRFAYLSWFMMALVIVYPLLKQYMFEMQNRVLAYIMLAYVGFTFLMNVIIY